MAEREGFEPSDPFQSHTISNRAHSTALAPLRTGSARHYSEAFVAVNADWRVVRPKGRNAKREIRIHTTYPQTNGQAALGKGHWNSRMILLYFTRMQGRALRLAASLSLLAFLLVRYGPDLSELLDLHLDIAHASNDQTEEHHHGDSDDHHEDGDDNCHHAHCCCSHTSTVTTLQIEGSVTEHRSGRCAIIDSLASYERLAQNIFHPPRV